MPVTSVGTPTGARGTVSGGTQTATWGTGQTRSAGNILACVITAGGSSVPALPASFGIWTQQFVDTNSLVSVALYTAVAAGGDAAWSHTVTFGTGGCNLLQYELAGGNPSSIIDVSGTNSASGASTVSITTSGSVSASGEFAVSAMGTENSSSVTRVMSSSSGWSDDLDDGSTSSRHHGIIGSLSSPSPGSTLNSSPSYTGGTLQNLVGLVAVFNAAPPPIPDKSTIILQAVSRASLW